MSLATAALVLATGGLCGRAASDGGQAVEPAGANRVGAVGLLADASTRGEAGGFVEGLGEGAARTSGRVSELPVDEEAARILDEYAAGQDCLVARSGWLDLLGRTWGCVVQGEGWVDVCVVSEGEDGGSEVGVMRMDASGLYEEEGG